MADRQARDILRTALTAFMRQEILSAEFNNVVSEYAWYSKSDDGDVRVIAKVLYAPYNDTRNELMQVTEEVWNALLRTLAFLQTDLGYSHERVKDLRRKWDAVRSFWPFASDDQWQCHKHLQPDPFPKWDPVLLPPVTKSFLRTLGEVLGILAVAIAIFVLIGAILNWWLSRNV